MLRQIIRGLASIIYPKCCLSCKAKINPEENEEPVCTKCKGEIKKNLPPFCLCCGRHLEKNSPYKSICTGCVKKRVHFDRCFSPCSYEGVIKKLIHEFKYKKATNLSGVLSEIMINFIKEYRLPVKDLDLIIPVPLHKARLREREFNQAKELSLPIAKEFKKEMLESALLRSLNTKTQTGLDNKERISNVAGSFKVKEDLQLKDKNILLVDDVLTTGSTASEAALALKNSGALTVFVLTLAN